MKNLSFFLLLLISSSAFAQSEFAKGDTLPPSQANRVRDGAASDGRRGEKASTGNFRKYAFVDEVTAATGGAVTSVNGLAGPSVMLTSNNIAENVNLYYTNARARLAISATGPVAYNNTTGVISMSAATNSVDGYLSAADRTLFASKEPAITAGTTLQYLRGDKSLATLNTTAVVEGSNLYYTDARARLSESATAPLVYNNSTGVTSIPLATNSVDGYLSAADRTLFAGKQSPQTTLAGYGITDGATLALTLPVTTVTAYSNISGVTLPATGTVKIVEVTTDAPYSETATLYVLRPNGKFRKIILGPDEN